MGLLGTDRSVFITGTDTSVGKTYLACHWIRFLTLKGCRVGVMKPIETGIVQEERSDGVLLRKAAKSQAPMDWISPYRFKTAAAPIVAARMENKRIQIQTILKKYRQLAVSHDRMIVEGAGGLMVPILKRFYMADLALALNLGVILVASERLGTINHTLLSIHAAQTRGIKILAVILNHRKSKEDPAIQTNAAILQESLEIPVLVYNNNGVTFSETSFWEDLEH